MSAAHSKLRRLGILAGLAAMGLAALSSVIALSVRDAFVGTGWIFFGVPWLVRLVLVGAAWLLVRPRLWRWRVLWLIVALHAMIQAGQSFRWRDPPLDSVGAFEVTLWNAGHNLAKMPCEWPRLAGPRTRLVVLIEAGSFSNDSWQRFTATHPELAWRRLQGGIVIGVKGKLIDIKPFGEGPWFHCQRLRVEIDGQEYAVLAVDMPAQPWLPRSRYLDGVRSVAGDRRCLMLGDFNTPPGARGFDAWRPRFTLANEAKARGFLETWCYGLPVLVIDQLWLSPDLKAVAAESTQTWRSDHVRMNFRVKPR